MKYLQSDKYEKVSVGLKTAPDLIRRKASFGTELSDQAVDLSRILVGLQDTFEMEKFQDMRQAALIALTASAAETVAPYLTNVFFTGDISIQQRCILLSALGIGARELGGLEQKVYLTHPLTLMKGTATTTALAADITSTVRITHGSTVTSVRSCNDRTVARRGRDQDFRTRSFAGQSKGESYESQTNGQTQSQRSLKNSGSIFRASVNWTVVDISTGLVNSLT